jgi:hypothetical protein
MVPAVSFWPLHFLIPVVQALVITFVPTGGSLSSPPCVKGSPHSARYSLRVIPSMGIIFRSAMFKRDGSRFNF